MKTRAKSHAELVKETQAAATSFNEHHSAWINECARKVILNEIEEWGGRELVFLAETDKCGVINKVRRIARGAIDMVPASLHHFRPGNLMLHNHPSENMTPSRADIEVLALVAQLGIGGLIINNEVTKRTEIIIPADPKEAHAILDYGKAVVARQEMEFACESIGFESMRRAHATIARNMADIHTIAKMVDQLHDVEEFSQLTLKSARRGLLLTLEMFANHVEKTELFYPELKKFSLSQTEFECGNSTKIETGAAV